MKIQIETPSYFRYNCFKCPLGPPLSFLCWRPMLINLYIEGKTLRPLVCQTHVHPSSHNGSQCSCWTVCQTFSTCCLSIFILRSLLIGWCHGPAPVTYTYVKVNYIGWPKLSIPCNTKRKWKLCICVRLLQYTSLAFGNHKHSNVHASQYKCN